MSGQLTRRAVDHQPLEEIGKLALPRTDINCEHTILLLLFMIPNPSPGEAPRLIPQRQVRLDVPGSSYPTNPFPLA